MSKALVKPTCNARQLYDAMPERQKELVHMLGYCRPAGSKSECEFIEKYVAPVCDSFDGHGNYIKIVGNNPHVLWSSHTDSVHTRPGKQLLAMNEHMITLAAGETSSCLGADCATGVWLMRNMIMREVPGVYVFHREEEVGGFGSEFICQKDRPVWLAHVKTAIAFDRKGYDSVITHQTNGRCASDKFATSLAKMLPGRYTADAGGTFTDTANYVDLVGECSNISVGYSAAHTVNEAQDYQFADKLLEHLCQLDQHAIAIERKPGDHGWDDADNWLSRYDFRHANSERSNRSMADLVKDYPDDIADILEGYGIDAHELRELLGLTRN